MSKKRQKLGMRLLESLSREQLAELLGAMFSALGKKTVERLSQSLEPDLAKTLQNVLARPPAVQVAPQGRLAERWRQLAAHCTEAVEWIGDEDGPCIHQNHHWEEPYFDGQQTVTALEKAAEEMLALLNSGLDPQVGDLSWVVEEIEQNMRGLPEWLGAEYGDPLELGPQCTGLILRMAWYQCKSPQEWFERIEELDEEGQFVRLDREGLVLAAAGLSREDRRTLHQALEARREEGWEAQSLPGSYWFRVLREIRRDFDPEGYLRQCCQSIPREWEKAFPVMEALAARQDWEEADTAATSAWQALSRTDLVPEGGLLDLQCLWRTDQDTVAAFLGRWEEIAGHLPEGHCRRAALQAQRSWVTRGSDWDAMRAVLWTVPDSAARDRLIQDWIRRTVKAHRCWADEPEHWVGWLLQVWSEAQPGSWFPGMIRGWLTTLPGDRQASMAARSPLSLLTLDVLGERELPERFPKLSAALQTVSQGRSEEHQISRRAWQRTGAESLREDLVRFWREAVCHMVPEPSRIPNACYGEHAVWVAVAMELNPPATRVLLTRWRAEHGRRRNLWKEIQAQGIA
ncbi:MAG: hypothetical protein HY319_21575 [Armatimonadetes bacterium]|nr:hypothetical protein [Armatimonadota bacterium]